MNHVIVLPELSLVERQRAKDRKRWSKKYLNMTDDQKANKKKPTNNQLGLSIIVMELQQQAARKDTLIPSAIWINNSVMGQN